MQTPYIKIRGIAKVAVIAGTLSMSIPLHAVAAADAASAKLSFARKCNRPATKLSGPSQSSTIVPRASRERPLQQPPHPTGARSRGEEGTVVMDIWVTETGDVSEVRVAKSSGYAELDMAAMRITEQWRLLPGTVNNVPVCMWGKFAVVFSLAANRSTTELTPFGRVDSGLR